MPASPRRWFSTSSSRNLRALAAGGFILTIAMHARSTWPTMRQAAGPRLRPRPLSFSSMGPVDGLPKSQGDRERPFRWALPGALAALKLSSMLGHGKLYLARSCSSWRSGSPARASPSRRASPRCCRRRDPADLRPEARARFLRRGRRGAWPSGYKLKNPALAKTFATDSARRARRVLSRRHRTRCCRRRAERTRAFPGGPLLRGPRKLPRHGARAGLRALPDASREHGPSVVRGRLDPELRARLFEQREQRPKPARDDKVVASWNGLLLAALAEAGRRLERDDWLDAAGGWRSSCRAAVGRGGAAFPDLAGGPVGRSRLPARLRGRCERLARVAHRYGGAALARGGEPAAQALRRAVRRPGARRVLPAAGEELVARRKDLEDQPTPWGTACSPGCSSPGADLRRRPARARGGWGLQADPCRRAAGAACVRLGAVRTRPPLLAAPGAGDCRPAGQRRGPGGAGVVRARHRRGRRPGRGVPLLEGKELVDGSGVYVCETSPAGLRSPTRKPAAA